LKHGFTLIELLVVIAIITLLMGILLPVLGRAREQAKVVAVNAELRQIGLALEMYMMDNENKYPPVREDCWDLENLHQLPWELMWGGYLPTPPSGTWMSAGMEDRFNRDRTYKYRAVGDLIQNQGRLTQNEAWLRIPEGFPDREGDPKEDRIHKNPLTSPVTWVIFSQGPNFNMKEMRKLHYPVPKRTWYSPKTRKGVITRMRLKKGGRHIGSFEGNG